MEAFQTYPATTRVTIAADRDEAAKRGKAGDRPGSRRGEIAARKFGVKHHEHLAVAIALPGEAGETADWLDVFRRAGPDAVRKAILAAASYVPTPAEIVDHKHDGKRAAGLNEIAATYPLPATSGALLTYAYTATGKLMVHKRIDGGDNGPTILPVASPFGVPARLRHADDADSYGLRVNVQDMGGRCRPIDIDRGKLARTAGTEVRELLFRAGLRILADGETIAVQCLKAADPEREIVVVNRPGWQEVAGHPDPVFITPAGKIIGAPEGLDLELASTARMVQDVAEGGTLAGWQNAVEAALSAPACEHWILGVLSAFAGPPVALTGLDTCGLNFSGMSTSGKTTAQRLAASAWSTPDIRRAGLFQSARATDNAIEALAQRASGTVLSLDELAHVSGKAAGKMIYTIAGGTGKRRLGADAGMRESYSWATFAILSGECSLEEKIRADGGDWTAGMAVRIVDVDVNGVNRTVDAATLRRINEIERHYGHAGPGFVRALIAHGWHRQALALRDRVNTAAKAIVGGETLNGATVRAAIPLALLLVAGDLAKDFALIPAATPITEAVQWAWEHFRASADANALDPETAAIANLRGFIAERWDVTIKNVDESRMNSRETIGWFDDSAIYIPRSRIREAIGGALKESQIGPVLDRRSLLASKPKEDRFCVPWVPKVGRIPAYALRRQEFGRSAHITEPDILTAHQGG